MKALQQRPAVLLQSPLQSLSVHCQLLSPPFVCSHSACGSCSPRHCHPFSSFAHSFCQLSDSVYFVFATVTVLSPDPGLGLSAPVPTYVCLKGSTMMTHAKNCSSVSCCCDHMFEWKHWCLILKIWDNSQVVGVWW